jgi:hypothetical protein
VAFSTPIIQSNLLGKTYEDENISKDWYGYAKAFKENPLNALQSEIRHPFRESPIPWISEWGRVADPA